MQCTNHSWVDEQPICGLEVFYSVGEKTLPGFSGSMCPMMHHPAVSRSSSLQLLDLSRHFKK